MGSLLVFIKTSKTGAELYRHKGAINRISIANPELREAFKGKMAFKALSPKLYSPSLLTTQARRQAGAVRGTWVGFYLIQILIYLFIYLFFGCVGSSFLCEGFLQLRQAGATLHRGARASHCRGLSCCGAQAPDAQAQQLWLTGLVAPRHVGSSQTRARTRIPCIGRQTLNHCATREALKFLI